MREEVTHRGCLLTWHESAECSPTLRLWKSERSPGDTLTINQLPFEQHRYRRSEKEANRKKEEDQRREHRPPVVKRGNCCPKGLMSKVQTASSPKIDKHSRVWQAELWAAELERASEWCRLHVFRCLERVKVRVCWNPEKARENLAPHQVSMLMIFPLWMHGPGRSSNDAEKSPCKESSDEALGWKTRKNVGWYSASDEL